MLQPRIQLVVLLSLLCLAGCFGNDSLKNHFEDYIARLANITGSTPPHIVDVPARQFPQRSELSAELDPIRIELNAFYALSGCAVNTLIAERNTALGQVQLPSTRYHYEVRLIAGLKDCIDDQSDEDALTTLHHWLSTKQNQLPLVWADLLQTSHEVKRAFSHDRGPVHGDARDGFKPTLDALTYLDTLYTHPNADASALEEHLKNLQAYRLPARIDHLQSWLANNLALSSDWLTSVTAAIDCSKPGQKQKVEYMQNVFNLIFAERIQPMTSQLNRYQYALLPVYQSFLQKSEISPAFGALLEAHIQGFAEYQQAMKTHIGQWQQLYKRCGITPGR